MPITVYNPAGIETIAKNRFVWVPSIADIAAPTIAEIDAGTEFSCALTEFDPGVDASESEDKRLCRKDAAKRSGSVTYSISDLPIIINDPQTADPFIDQLESGVTGFIAVFPNIAPGTATAAAQRAWIYAVTVKTKTPQKFSTDDGELFTMVVGWSVTARNLKATVAAGA